VVDLSSVGAIIGFGYASAAVLRMARRDGNRRDRVFGAAGLILSIVFLIAQLIPRISTIETMAADSYLLLSIWCLIGFAFYWRAMNANTGDAQVYESVTVSALFFLLIFSSVIWYAKLMSGRGGTGSEAIAQSAMFVALISLGLFVMLMIHTRLKDRQMELDRERIRAIENSEAKSNFLFSMSHDIRTPMNAILGYAYLALQKETAEPQRLEYLRKIESSGNQLLGIINDVLDMGQIESGRLDMFREPVNLPKSVLEIRDTFSDQMQAKGIRFSVDVSGVERE